MKKQAFDEGGFDYFKKQNDSGMLNESIDSYKSRQTEYENLKKREMDLKSEIHEA